MVPQVFDLHVKWLPTLNSEEAVFQCAQPESSCLVAAEGRVRVRCSSPSRAAL